MKLRFEPDLDFQLQAVEAVCGLFRGQEVCRTEFTVTRDAADLPFHETGLGIGNRLTLVDDDILENLRDTQLHNGLPQSESLESGDFTVEMETGTGKTYVYLRTIFELNKRYGFTKFVVVVPSVAIKEGVYKSLQLTDDYFRSLYAGVPFEYFLYDSAKLGQVRNFATSPQIQIYGGDRRRHQQEGREQPLQGQREDGRRATDRPHQGDAADSDRRRAAERGRRAGRARQGSVGRHEPLGTLRYSATHVDKYHMVYRLHAVDAYQRRLVNRSKWRQQPSKTPTTSPTSALCLRATDAGSFPPR